MKMNKTIFLAVLLCLFPLIAKSQTNQTKTIYGKVTTLDNLPVCGIEISSKEAKTKTLSDSLGNFVIVSFKKDKLKFKGKIFNNQNVKISSETPDTISVNMTFATSNKNVELAIGYGYITEKDRTQAIEYIKHKQDYCSYLSIYDILRNNFNNLVINDDGCVIIRGPSSLYASNCAMYVVDGIKVNNIDYISPCEVKDISVLKDGSAAIYGSRSATGVILINLRN